MPNKEMFQIKKYNTAIEIQSKIVLIVILVRHLGFHQFKINI